MATMTGGMQRKGNAMRTRLLRTILPAAIVIGTLALIAGPAEAKSGIRVGFGSGGRQTIVRQRDARSVHIARPSLRHERPTLQRDRFDRRDNVERCDQRGRDNRGHDRRDVMRRPATSGTVTRTTTTTTTVGGRHGTITTTTVTTTATRGRSMPVTHVPVRRPRVVQRRSGGYGGSGGISFTIVIGR